MTPETYSSRTANEFLQGAEKKKISFKVLKGIILRAYYGGACAGLKDVIDIQRENPALTIEELIGDVEMVFSKTSKELNKVTSPKMNMEVKLEDLRSYSTVTVVEKKMLSMFNNFKTFEDVKAAKEHIDALLSNDETISEGAEMQRIIQRYMQ